MITMSASRSPLQAQQAQADRAFDEVVGALQKLTLVAMKAASLGL